MRRYTDCVSPQFYNLGDRWHRASVPAESETVWYINLIIHKTTIRNAVKSFINFQVGWVRGDEI